MESEVREQPQRSPNARLQDEILLYLEAGHTVDSVAELARQLGAPRPSVSRAINSLASGGFVSREGEGWTLTETGKEEARQLWDRRSDQLERYEMRPLIEALNSFVHSAEGLDRVSEQIQHLTHLTENAPKSSKDDVRYLRGIFEEWSSMMEPLRELADRMQPLLSQFESLEEGAELPELNTQDRRLLWEMARAYERAQSTLERVSEGMKILDSLIDKLASAERGESSADTAKPKDTHRSGDGIAIPH